LIDLLKQDKVQKIQLTVSPLNISALGLYEKFLFYQIDYNKDEYGKGEDRIFLELNLERLKNGK
jgi:ribosomal protein S18 acetylase RimI-like enzyme